MKTFISWSFGVESTAMCLLYGRGSTALWCDTGIEEDELYERVDYCENRLTEYHNGDFKLERIYPEVIAKGIVCKTIDEAALAWKFYPSPQARWCTDKFKIEPIEKRLEQEPGCELLIGFNADEIPGEDRVGNLSTMKNVKIRYPLIEDGLYRSDCEELLRMHDLHPNYPVYMSRGGCRTCFYRKKGELKAKAVFAPEAFDRDIETEKSIQDKRTNFYHLNMNIKGGYQDIKNEVQREIQQWGIDAVKQMYSKVKSHDPCGAFCHR